MSQPVGFRVQLDILLSVWRELPRISGFLRKLVNGLKVLHLGASCVNLHDRPVFLVMREAFRTLCSKSRGTLLLIRGFGRAKIFHIRNGLWRNVHSACGRRWTSNLLDFYVRREET